MRVRACVNEERCLLSEVCVCVCVCVRGEEFDIRQGQCIGSPPRLDGKVKQGEPG